MILFHAEVMRRLDAIETRLRALEKPVQPVQRAAPASGQSGGQSGGLVCGQCGAERTTEPCRLNDISRCTFLSVKA